MAGEVVGHNGDGHSGGDAERLAVRGGVGEAVGGDEAGLGPVDKRTVGDGIAVGVLVVGEHALRRRYLRMPTSITE